MADTRKLTAIKRLEARSENISRGGHVIRKDEIQPPLLISTDGFPQPPVRLSKRAISCWKWLIDAYHELGIITILDARELAYYCELDGRFWETIAEGDNPPSWMYSALRQFSPMFGMDPLSRGRSGFPGTNEVEEPLDQLRHRRTG